MANLTAGERTEIQKAVQDYVEMTMASIIMKINNDQNLQLKQVNEAMDQIMDAAHQAQEIYAMMDRMKNLVEALDGRLEDVESHLGW